MAKEVEAKAVVEGAEATAATEELAAGKLVIGLAARMAALDAVRAELAMLENLPLDGRRAVAVADIKSCRALDAMTGRTAFACADSDSQLYARRHGARRPRFSPPALGPTHT